MRGINLGGWLVLERWMTPSLFDGYAADDEHDLCIELGERKYDVLSKHRSEFITKKDFQWIARQGFEAVRLPVGHWIFESTAPYVESSDYVTQALKWAKSCNLKVIIDLHTAPGSQNGWAHSGKRGMAGWHIDQDCIDQTVEIISEIAEMYGQHPNLYGIELLNEPQRDISLRTLKTYYRRAYEAARAHTDSRVAIIVSDAYRPIAEWEDFIREPIFENMLLDVHLYQTFDPRDKKLSFDAHIAKALKWRRTLDAFGADKIIVGEWSSVLDGVYDKLDAQTARDARDLYVQTQQYAFSAAAGHFYWNYKTENSDNWSYRTGLLET